MTSKVRKGIRRTIAALAAIASLMSVSACSGGSNTAADGTVVSIFNGTTGTFNENFNPFSPTALGPTLGVIYETLYWYNLASDEDPTPMLATGYEWNEDGSELTITTRKGVKWQDGEPFSAKDVAFTFNLIHNTPALNTNGTACTAEVIDDTHVKLIFPTKNADGTEFDEPFTGAYMQEGGILGGQAIVPEHIWKNVKDPMNYTNADPIGTGSFKLDKFTNQSYSFKAFKDYWNGKPKIDGVRYVALNDASAATSTLMAGQVDWMSAYIPSYKMLLKNYPAHLRREHAPPDHRGHDLFERRSRVQGASDRHGSAPSHLLRHESYPAQRPCRRRLGSYGLAHHADAGPRRQMDHRRQPAIHTGNRRRGQSQADPRGRRMENGPGRLPLQER